jgi:hypothetical protein
MLIKYPQKQQYVVPNEPPQKNKTSPLDVLFYKCRPSNGFAIRQGTSLRCDTLRRSLDFGKSCLAKKR